MIYRDTHNSLRALSAVAGHQAGYFTAKQASGVGYGYSHLSYHLHVGNFVRAGHGIYRMSLSGYAEHDDLVRLALWSRDRHDRPQAVVSHATALFLHQLSDVLPRRVHLTVPPSFRKQPPGECILHKAWIEERDIDRREGFSVTTPLRTLLDAAEDVTLADEQLRRAVKDSLQRGLIRMAALSNGTLARPAASRLRKILASIERAT